MLHVSIILVFSPYTQIKGTSTSYKICKGLFLVLLAIILFSLYTLPDLLNRDDVEFSALFPHPLSDLFPALLAIVIPLIAANKLRNRIILFLPYALYVYFAAGPWIVVVGYAYIGVPFLALVIGHYVLEVLKKASVTKIMIPVLAVILVASLITWTLLIINHNKRVIEIRIEHEESWKALEFAAKNKDPRLCENISEQSTKDSCYYEFGRYLTDPLLCNKIQSLNLKTPCLETVSAKHCTGITTQASRDECFLQVIRSSNSVHASICGEIENSTSRDDCFMQVAKNSKLTSICDGIQNQSVKNKCFDDVVLLISQQR